MTSGSGTVTPRFLKSTFAKICARVQIRSISANYQANYAKTKKRTMMNFAISPTAMSGYRKNEGAFRPSWGNLEARFRVVHLLRGLAMVENVLPIFVRWNVIFPIAHVICSLSQRQER